MVIAETAKQYYHRGQRPKLYFYRDRSGNNWHVLPVKDIQQIHD
jgi:hypothetical protein